jgi:hypothetical protein
MQRPVREIRNGYKILVKNPEGNRSLGRPRRRLEDNIKLDLKGPIYDQSSCATLRVVQHD